MAHVRRYGPFRSRPRVYVVLNGGVQSFLFDPLYEAVPFAEDEIHDKEINKDKTEEDR